MLLRIDSETLEKTVKAIERKLKAEKGSSFSVQAARLHVFGKNRMSK